VSAVTAAPDPRAVAGDAAKRPASDVLDLPGLARRLRVDTSERQPVYLLETGNGSYARLSPSAFHLLEQRSGGRSFAELAEIFSRQQDQPVSPEQVEEAYGKVVERIRGMEQRAAPFAWGMWLHGRLIPAERAAALGRRLSVAFQPWVAIPLLLLSATAAAGALGPRMFSSGLSAGAIWTGYLLFLLSLLVHELGHASACARYGARPSDIGAGVSLFYPVLYSDVTAAWELTRRQRVVVDLGGIFFQSVLGGLCTLGFWATGWAPLRVTCLLIAASCVFSLNPFFKFDGYWVLADALGVTNLSSQPGRLLAWLRDRAGGRKAPLPWAPALTVVLALYSVVSVAVWARFLGFALPAIGRSLARLPALAALIADDFHRGGRPSWGHVSAFALACYFALLAGLALWRAAQNLRHKLAARRAG
jgi:putative peptide zinc metalloprotease protein